MNNEQLLKVKLNTLANRDLNDMLPLSSYLIGLAYPAIGINMKQGSEAEMQGGTFYVLTKAKGDPSVCGVLRFEMFKDFRDQPEDTQKTVYNHFKINY